MNRSKSLAWAQVAIITASLIMSITIMVHIGQGKSLSWAEMSAIWSGSLGISFVGFVLSITQIVYSDKDNNKMELIAGILGMLIIIPFVELLSLAANFFIITEEPFNN